MGVDVHSNIFNEYLSSAIAKLSKENKEYRAIQAEIEGLCEKYPKVFGVFDTEKSAELTKEECTTLIEVLELKTSSRTWKCSPSISVAAMTA